MKYVYSNDGQSSRSVPNDYQVKTGEVIFDDAVSDQQLTNAFPNFVQLKNQQEIKRQIRALEATQTPRRIREALTDPTWMEALDVQIAALRAQLT